MPKRGRYKSYAWTHPKTGLLYARVQIKQPDGTMKTYLKRAQNKKHAEQLGDEMMADYAERKTGFVEGESMSFADFAEWYKKKYVVPPVYSVAGEKVSGMRTHAQVSSRIDHLKKFFGKILLKKIDEDLLDRYKSKREKDGVLPATINRDFEILRAMFRKAKKRKWLKESPFESSENLIEKALERTRDELLSETEESALLHYTKASEKSVLYYIFLCLLDCGARPSEIYDASTIKAEPVKWKSFFDYDFKAVQLVSLKGKKRIVRIAPVTRRLEAAMRELWNSLKSEEQNIQAQIFPFTTFKTAWATARKNADLAIKISEREKIPLTTVWDGTFTKDELKDFAKEFKDEPLKVTIRLRDLRRNFSTRLANLGMENDLRQRILGHTQAQTTFDYTAADLRTALQAKEMLDAENSEVILESKANN